ncbi:hypothetical protein [Sapientia aquatica]|uniref:hypothetical protein n=1 Tax=Sapientia aquatica TaxID=1549640 RepID=UPI0014053B1D|nr:hypothetical protein [Sapientia aquatica]
MDNIARTDAGFALAKMAGRVLVNLCIAERKKPTPLGSALAFVHGDLVLAD